MPALPPMGQIDMIEASSQDRQRRRAIRPAYELLTLTVGLSSEGVQ